MTAPLIAAFLARAPATCRPPPELGHVLARQLAVARATHPELRVDPERFAGRLGERCGCYDDVLEATRETHGSDVYLVLAAEGSEHARNRIRALVTKHEPALRTFVTTTRGLDDVLDAFWTQIDLASYDGSDPLCSWLMTTGIGALAHWGWTREIYQRRPWWSDFAIDLEFVDAPHRDRFALALHESLLALDIDESILWNVALTGGLQLAILDDNVRRRAELFQRPMIHLLPSEIVARARRNASAALELALQQELSEREVAAIMALVPDRIDALFLGMRTLQRTHGVISAGARGRTS